MSATDDDRPPERLYKYRGSLPPDDLRELPWHMEPIVESRLFFAPPALLNDPFDCSPSWQGVPTTAEIAAYQLRAGSRNLRERPSRFRVQAKRDVSAKIRSVDFIRATWEALLEHEVGIHSLSQHADQPLMWAHYGGNHKGYCLEFSNLGKYVLKSNDADFMPLRVHYSAQRHVVSTSEFLHHLGTRTAGENWLWDMLCRKDVNWSYEGEWRLIVGRAGASIAFPPQLMTGIILGARCSTRDEQLLREWEAKRSRRIEIRRIVPSTADFSLSIARTEGSQ